MIRNFRALIGAVVGLALALPVFVLMSPFLGVSWLTRFLGRRFEPLALPWQRLIEFDPEFGWKPRANLRAQHLADDGYWSTTDGQGWRGKTSLAESEIVVFGDSFAWGYGMDDEHVFCNLLTQPRIKPVGVNGYNMVQESLWMQRYASQLRGKLVVWLIYHGNDLYDNLSPDMQGYRTPFVRQLNGTGDWEIVATHLRPERWPIGGPHRRNGSYYHEKLAELCSPTYLAQRAYSACEFLLREGQELCRRNGAGLAVVTIPDLTQFDPQVQFLRTRRPDLQSIDPDYPDRMIREMCGRLGLPFEACKQHMDASHFKADDCHWNRKGHRQMADLLAAIYRRETGRESHRERSKPCLV